MVTRDERGRFTYGHETSDLLRRIVNGKRHTPAPVEEEPQVEPPRGGDARGGQGRAPEPPAPPTLNEALRSVVANMKGYPQ